MRAPRCCLCFIATIALVAAPRLARAEPAERSDLQPAARTVLVTKVGHSDDWGALENRLREFLLPHGLQLMFETQERLGRLDELRDREEGLPHVWIELISAERARLVLSDSRRGRYLLRDVTLHNGLDEVGRETLSQVIEASLLALQGQAQALSREQVERLLEPPSDADAAPAGRPSAPPGALALASSKPAQPRKALVRDDETERTRSSLRVAPSYLLRWTGPHLGALHALGASVAWQRALARSWLGVALSYELRFPQRYTDSLVGVSVRGHNTWLTSRLELPRTGGLALVAEAGFGLAWSNIAPSEVEGGLARLAVESTDVTAWLRFELGFERRWHTWSVQISAVSDVAIHDTHYDVTRDGRRERWITPWPISPGLRLALGWES